MAKKSTQPVVYTSPIKDVPQISQSSLQVAQIPPYPDKAVEYKQYYKRKISDSEFVLRNQATRFYSLLCDFDSGAPSLIGTVTSGKTFYARSMSVQYGGFGARKVFIIYDGNENNPKLAFTVHSGEKQTFEVYFHDSPRAFLQSLLLFTGIVLWEDTAYIHITFYGWEEEN
jgi:hypothetical protein